MCTHLVKRGSVYYFRRKIPLDLIAHYDGKKEVMRSLRTSDKREAEKLAREEGVRLDREFAQLRGPGRNADAPAAGSDPQPSLPPPKAIDVDYAARRYLAHLRKARDEAVARGEAALEFFMDWRRSQLAEHEEILQGKAEPLQPLAYHEAHRNALRAFLLGDGSVIELGSHAAGPRDVKVKTYRLASVGIELSGLIDKWAAEKQPKSKTVSRTRSIALDFAKRVGVSRTDQITRQHVLRYKDALLDDGESAANINVKLPMLGVIFNYACDNDLGMSANPAAKIRVADKRRAKDKRREFDTAALNAIFSSRVFTEGYRPLAGAGEAAYWLPLLALFTGARIEELAQLRPEDIYEESYTDADGGERKAWVLRITGDQAEGQEIKTESSERRVPLHAELLRLGFVAFSQEAKGRARIFHKLRPDVDGKESGNFSKWFSRYLRGDCKVTDERMVFHSFRHTFKHLARLAAMPTEVHNALTGHVTGNVADNYGGFSYPLAPLVDAVSRYRVAGVLFPETRAVE
ncbi:site-specific integrase [Trinickia mobilis]|uniref:site-specific integrase n=1 Tax=Trinickia mobilis TaxID=2816356 RepID=UPI001A8F91D0|nr:site-specific integrase [Trinickia mobilis]